MSDESKVPESGNGDGNDSTELTALDVQEPNAIVPVRPKFVDDDRDAEIKTDADKVAAAVLADPANAEVTIQVYEIGADLMSANTQHVQLMDTRIADVMREVSAGNPVVKTLTRIKTELDLVNPAVVAQTEISVPRKVFFGLITRVSKYVPKGDQVLEVINQRRDSIATTIDGLKRHLWEARDKAFENAVQLAQISNRLFETQRDLQEAAYMGQLVWKKLSEALTNETDPVRRQALQTLVNDLAVQVVDIQTVDTLNVQSRLGAETLIANTRKIQQGVRRTTDVLLPAVATNLMVKAAANQQMQLTQAQAEIGRAAEQVIADTAKATKETTVEIERLQSQALINPEKLQEACENYISMVEDLEAIRQETENKARETSQALARLGETMRDHADPLTRNRKAREAAEAEKE